MIDLKFALFWSGGPMSLLRYLTFKSLRRQHPHSNISLFVSNSCDRSNTKWEGKKHDFSYPTPSKEDYKLRLQQELNVEVINCDIFSDFHPNFQADLFRWWWLSNNSGFYLDTDIIVLKPFDTLPLDRELIFSQYNTKTEGMYSPTAVIGSSGKSKTIKFAKDEAINYYSKKDYDSIGSFLFKQSLAINNGQEERFNAPSEFFYPIAESFMIEVIFRNTIKLSNLSYGLHWFGGSEASFELEKVYTEKYSTQSNDTISTVIKEI